MTKIPKPDKDDTRKENYVNKYLNKMVTKIKTNIIKKEIRHDQLRFILGIARMV